jgi:hypothetical protein
MSPIEASVYCVSSNDKSAHYRSLRLLSLPLTLCHERNMTLSLSDGQSAASIAQYWMGDTDMRYAILQCIAFHSAVTVFEKFTKSAILVCFSLF